MRTNRYANSVLIKDNDGDWISPVIPPIDVRERRTDTIHVVKDGDRLDLLAYQYLRDPNMWWVIAEYNRIFWFQNIEVGMRLRIPSYETFYLELMRG